ncbi:hypothetical protein Pfo_025711 [Paulownia fortunei]|nr:hypothetical protein Pfo_025711 [Paulownia fortunei]
MGPEPVILTTRNAVEVVGLIRADNTLSFTYVTFLACDGDYVKGVVCLAKGLMKVKLLSEHRNLLVNQGCLLREIDPVCPPVGNKKSPFIRVYFAVNYNKLCVWEMVNLDADIQVLRTWTASYHVQWPEDLGNEPPVYFIGSMFVFEPNTSKPIPPIYNFAGSKPWKYTGKEQYLYRADVKMLI